MTGYNPNLNSLYGSSLFGSTTAISDVVRNMTVTFLADDDLGCAVVHTVFEDPKGQDIMKVYPAPILMVAEQWVREAEAEALWWMKYEAQCSTEFTEWEGVDDDDLIEVETNTNWEEFQ